MKIYGYIFKISIEKGEWGYVAYAPGVGGVYEEGETKDEAISNAYESACAIIETRLEQNDPIIENNPYIRVLNALPTLRSLVAKKGAGDEYIATPRCMIPAGVN